ncbi:MAG: C-GCAxxG-C-C family (seleno)protein [Promethearchaeota archaeon]
MSKNKQLIEKARRLGKEYLVKYGGCAQGTLQAVADTLNLEVCESLFKAMIGLSSLSGGCGSICGGIAAIGLKYGVKQEILDANRMGPETQKIWGTVKLLRDKFVKEYGGFLCTEIQTKLFGKSFDSFNPVEMQAFMEMNPMEKCSSVTENAAGWTVEAILEMENK